MAFIAGSAIDDTNRLIGVVGTATFIDPLEELNGYLLVSAQPVDGPVREILVLADSVAAADALAERLPGVVGTED